MTLNSKNFLKRSHLFWIAGIVFTVILLFSYLPSISHSYVDTDFERFVQNTNNTSVFFFFGTRPEVIKMAPVIIEFEKSKHFNIVKVFTGQHPNLIQQFLTLFGIRLDIHIDSVMDNNQSLSQLIAKMVSALDKRIESNPTDIWIVQGDTSTSFAAALVAFNRNLRIGHIEAGLRTYNMRSPFPEEFNRETISSIATYHFAPTSRNELALLSEGVPKDRIFVTGNTVIDAMKFLETKRVTSIPDVLDNKIKNDSIVILLTMHRRENFDRMSFLYNTLHSVPCKTCRYIIPVHPNPNAAKPARAICDTDSEHFICIPSLSYQDLHLILNRSQFVLTDSGGLQEEATWYRKPTLVLRDHTDRMEAIEAGVSVLISHDYEKLKILVSQLINMSSTTYKQMSKTVFPFGYGNASLQIFNSIISIEKQYISSVSLSTPSLKQSKSVDLGPILNKKEITLGLVLQVYGRNSLHLQLSSALSQSLRPKTIIILQNGFHVNITETIKMFREKYPDVEIQHIASSKNLRYHGRFHLAYMMAEDYVSIWDDDVLPRRDWLKYSVEYSQKHGNALVGANGRTFEGIAGSTMRQIEKIGRNDFVGHTWTLLRVLLKYYIEMKPFTLHTGEDIQLAFALQKVGIEAHKPMQSGERSAPDALLFTSDKNASFLKNQSPRLLLFCKVLKAGFKPISCSNCNDSKVLSTCIQKYEKGAASVENETRLKDRSDNNRVIWHA